MKTTILNKILLFFSLLVNLTGILFLIFYSHPKLPVINLNEIEGYHKEFNFSPVVNNGFVSNTNGEYPHVQIGLNDIRYFYIVFKEARDLNNNKYDHTFYASKRISELIKWGDSIPVIKPQHLEKLLEKRSDPKIVISELRKWHSDRAFNFNSWESSLLRFTELVESKEKQLTSKLRINRQGSIEEIIVLSSRNRTYHADLTLTIQSLNISEENKKYLLTLSNTTFSYLNGRINKNLPSFSPTNIYFPLSDITNEREYGVYDVSVYNFGTWTDAYKSSTLKVGNRNYKAAEQTDTENELLYKDIEIFDSTHNLASFNDSSLIIKTRNLSSELMWIRERKTNIYRADFNDEELNSQYYFKIKSGIEKPITVTITHLNGNKENKINTIIPRQLVNRRIDIKAGGTSTIEEIIKLTGLVNNPPRFRVRIESDTPLTVRELEHISLETTRFNSPLISLRKNPQSSARESKVTVNRVDPITFNIQITNTSLTEDKYIAGLLGRNWEIMHENLQYQKNNDSVKTFLVKFKPFRTTYFLLLAINSLIALILFSYLIKRLIRSLIQFGINLLNSLFRVHIIVLARRFKYLILLIFLFELIFDVFIMHSYSDVILVGIVISWIALLTGFSLNSGVTFTAALFLLALAPIVLLNGIIIAGEKLVILAFTLLVIAVAQLIREMFSNSNSDWHFLIRKVAMPLEIVIIKLENAASHVLNQVLKLVHRIFILPPVTFRDRLNNGISFFLLMVFVIFGAFVTVKLYGIVEIQLNVYRQDKIRLSRHPRINTIEPKIVYYANKILITGDQFGWKENDTVLLNSEMGEIKTDLWTDNKIIFTVPLHWDYGKKKIWIERYTSWNNKPYKARSNEGTIVIIPRSEVFTDSDELYFEQLNSMSDEVLHLNGYR